MPRQARLDMPGALHHIMIRGMNKSDIFVDDEDRTKFLERLGRNVQDAKCSVYAWVLMSNHVHVLFKSGEKGISAVMRKLLTWYAQYFNRKHERTGHLFENRYKSILCEEDKYLLALVRYIHFNPIRAGMLKNIEELNKYSWSGHRLIIRNSDKKWIDSDYVLAQFSKKKNIAIRKYIKFMKEGLKIGNEDLSGGGLIKSVGGWSNIISMRRRDEKIEFDERILGDSDFVYNILKDAEQRQIRQLRLRKNGKKITDLIEEECKKLRINPIELKSGSRRKRISEARAKIACRSMEELGLRAAEIAGNLGVNTSAITKAITRFEKQKNRS